MAIVVSVKSSSQEKEYTLFPGESIMEMLRRQEQNSLSFCGGKGICGRCRIQFTEAAPMPKPEERKCFTPAQLRAGMRLACLSRPNKDCTIYLDWGEEQAIVSAYHKEYLDRSLLEQADDSLQGKKMIAIDLGTTTIVMQLISVQDGRIIRERRFLNPQRRWGADVISRMEASIRGERDKIKEVTEMSLLSAIFSMTNDTDICITIAGNTVMKHLLLGYDVTGLSVFPFTPISLEEVEIQLGAYRAIMLPDIASFVGADITAGIYALGMQHTEQVNLLVDLGTNGEIVIGNKEMLLATATAAGPAFEGGVLTKLQGTDMISETANMLEQGIVDKTGLLTEPYFKEGYPIDDVEKICISQQDIRNLQMAKAAIYAGITILQEQYAKMTKRNITIGNVYLAGGFGYYLDVQKANRIGLLPEYLLEKVVAVGNTSLLGAYFYGRACMKAQKNGNIKDTISQISQIPAKTKTLNLANQEDFQARYLDAMNFT